MATSRVSTNLSTVWSVFHLIFTILAIAILSYKVYYLESEIYFIRKEISSGELSAIQTTPLSTAPTSEQHRSGRNRRVNQKKSESSSTDQLQAECMQKILNNMRVSKRFSLLASRL